MICAAFAVLFAVAIEGAPAGEQGEEGETCGMIRHPGAVATNSQGCAQIAM